MNNKKEGIMPAKSQTQTLDFDPSEHAIALVVVNISNYQSIVSKLLQKLVRDKHVPSVYINLNKPYDTIAKNMSKDKIDPNSIIFIDSVTTIRDELKRAENCLFLGHHQNLTDISIATSEAVEAITSENKILFLDSINNLLIYNDHTTVLRFTRFLIGKLRNWKCGAVIFVLKEKSSEDLIKEISQATDIVIDYGGEE